ncbi:MAG: hypothetical protein N2V73_03235 [Candidatus Methanospirare jalkutatii]|nr:hypothetical protein [Candidatus Methanospirare jalkutatii]
MLYCEKTLRTEQQVVARRHDRHSSTTGTGRGCAEAGWQKAGTER